MKKNKLICGGRLLEMVMNFYSPIERLGVLSGYEATLSFPCCQEISYLLFHSFYVVSNCQANHSCNIKWLLFGIYVLCRASRSIGGLE